MIGPDHFFCYICEKNILKRNEAIHRARCQRLNMDAQASILDEAHGFKRIPTNACDDIDFVTINVNDNKQPTQDEIKNFDKNLPSANKVKSNLPSKSDMNIINDQFLVQCNRRWPSNEYGR